MDTSLQETSAKSHLSRFVHLLVTAIFLSNAVSLLLDQGALSPTGLVWGLTAVPVLLLTLTGFRIYRRTETRWRLAPQAGRFLMPLAVLPHAATDGLLIGLAWSVDSFLGLTTAAAVFLHEGPHLWAQYHFWKERNEPQRYLALRLFLYSLAGVAAGLVLHFLLLKGAAFDNAFQALLGWVMAAIFSAFAVHNWARHSQGADKAQSLLHLAFALLLSLPFFLLHLLLHGHAH